MDEELKQYLVGMEARITAASDSKLSAMESRLDAKIDAMGEKIYKTETTLLTEFHKWASPLESRLNTHRHWFYEVDAQVESLKQRLEKLEGQRPPR